MLGSGAGLVPVHGDFAPWNTAAARDGYAVWDWEEARLGLPLEDYFHWHVQMLVLFGVGSVETIVHCATSPQRDLAELGHQLGLDAEAPVRALRAYLERRLAAPGPSEVERILVGALELLDARTE